MGGAPGTLNPDRPALKKRRWHVGPAENRSSPDRTLHSHGRWGRSDCGLQGLPLWAIGPGQTVSAGAGSNRAGRAAGLEISQTVPAGNFGILEQPGSSDWVPDRTLWTLGLACAGPRARTRICVTADLARIY